MIDCFLFQLAPSHGGALLAQAEQLNARGDLPGAISFLRDVVSKHPRFADAHYNLAVYLRAFVSDRIIV